MKKAKQRFWKTHKVLFALILFAIGFMVVGTLTDVGTGIAIATVAPLVWIKGGKFTQELTAKEFENLKEEERETYLKELKQSKDEMQSKLMDDKIKKTVKDLVSKEEFKAFEKTLNELKDYNIKARLAEYDKIIAKINKDEFNKEPKDEDNFEKALKKAWEGVKDKFAKDSDIHSADMSIKALPMSTATWSASSDYPFLQDDQEAGIAKAPITPLTFVQDVATLAPIAPNKDTWTWVERGTVTDGTNTSVAEAGAFGSIEVAYNKQQVDVTKTANYTKITREMLEDWSEFSMAVNELIDELLMTSLNTELATYIQSIAAEFDANGITATAPGIWDVIRVTIAQIFKAGKTQWMPTRIYMNPIDVADKEIEKDDNGNYLFPPFLMPNGMQVKGITITETTDVDEGYFKVADMRKIGKRFKRSVDIRVWEQNATDVQNDLLTITGSFRYAKRIKTVDYGAFVYDSFDAAIAILTSAAASVTLIQGMATYSDASKLTINLLTAAGVTGTDAADLDSYKVAIAAEASLADLAAIQSVIDGV
jgi:hypothetical protein